MRFIDSTLKDNLTRDKMRMAVSVAAVVVLSLLVFISVYTLLDSRVRADRARRNAQADVLLDAVESTQAESSETETVSETQVEETTETTIDMLAPSVASAETEALSETAAEAGEETSEVQVEETAAAVDPNAVEEYYASVYAASDINLRSGPGTDYDIVRVIHRGEGIDVTGRTGSGWYRTYSGNYVLIELTTTEPVATTAAATSATTAAPTAAATTAGTVPTTPPMTESNTAGSASTDGMTYYGVCHITFYGPQPLGDGSYSTTTATGTSCSEGRTVAADWSIFPA
ncbi:MAG: SH3 domain-containing protein, partial [Clostridiales bacterium]|nr:SH3 domain-containing protein [Clostridiales bacterium]